MLHFSSFSLNRRVHQPPDSRAQHLRSRSAPPLRPFIAAEHDPSRRRADQGPHRCHLSDLPPSDNTHCSLRGIAGRQKLKQLVRSLSCSLQLRMCGLIAVFSDGSVNSTPNPCHRISPSTNRLSRIARSSHAIYPPIRTTLIPFQCARGIS